MIIPLALILIIIIALATSSPLIQWGGSGSGSGSSRPFSNIGEDIGQGVTGSYSGRPNGPTDRLRALGENTSQKPPMTYYGHGIPLKAGERSPGPFLNPLKTPHHKSPKCSPKCCPSPYSCDHGCVCYSGPKNWNF